MSSASPTNPAANPLAGPPLSPTANPWQGVSTAACEEPSRLSLHDETWQSAHRHAFVLWVVLSGHAMLNLRTQPLSVSSGVILLMLPGTPVRVRPKTGSALEVVSVAFTWEHNGRPLRAKVVAADDGPRLSVSGLGELAMTATMRNAYLAVPHRMLSAHQRFRDARTAWMEVDIQLLRVIQDLSLIGAEPEATQARPRQTRASRTARYLYSHVSEPVTLRDMAAHVGVGVSTLCKEFREQYGTSPMKFLAEERMARARSLLESPDFRIQEIAVLCGFASPQLFSRVFKAAHGVSPRAYRAQR